MASSALCSLVSASASQPGPAQPSHSLCGGRSPALEAGRGSEREWPPSSLSWGGEGCPRSAQVPASPQPSPCYLRCPPRRTTLSFCPWTLSDTGTPVLLASALCCARRCRTLRGVTLEGWALERRVESEDPCLQGAPTLRLVPPLGMSQGHPTGDTQSGPNALSVSLPSLGLDEA